MLKYERGKTISQGLYPFGKCKIKLFTSFPLCLDGNLANREGGEAAEGQPTPDSGGGSQGVQLRDFFSEEGILTMREYGIDLGGDSHNSSRPP